MSDLEKGDYNLQNIEFLVVLGETTRKTSTSEANADKLPQHSEMTGLPRQISVSPTGFEPPTVSPPADRSVGFDLPQFHVNQRESDGLYEISFNGKSVTFPVNGKVCSQEKQKFAWTLHPQPDIGPDVYSIANGEQQWYLTDDADYTPVSLKVPQKSDKPNVFMWLFSPV
ncbi:hypothetical protein EIP86_005746 [Pleurotus ostreatoroseus]|nr:hypothetical protein EIP86_005746 [Pleurotus ostreatoroseus]